MLKSPVELHLLACCRDPGEADRGVRDAGAGDPRTACPLEGSGVLRGLGEGIGDTLLELWESECSEPVD